MGGKKDRKILIDRLNHWRTDKLPLLLFYGKKKSINIKNAKIQKFTRSVKFNKHWTVCFDNKNTHKIEKFHIEYNVLV